MCLTLLGFRPSRVFITTNPTSTSSRFLKPAFLELDYLSKFFVTGIEAAIGSPRPFGTSPHLANLAKASSPSQRFFKVLPVT
jgi:hypothetical protein